MTRILVCNTSFYDTLLILLGVIYIFLYRRVLKVNWNLSETRNGVATPRLKNDPHSPSSVPTLARPTHTQSSEKPSLGIPLAPVSLFLICSLEASTTITSTNVARRRLLSWLFIQLAARSKRRAIRVRCFWGRATVQVSDFEADVLLIFKNCLLGCMHESISEIHVTFPCSTPLEILNEVRILVEHCHIL